MTYQTAQSKLFGAWGILVLLFTLTLPFIAGAQVDPFGGVGIQSAGTSTPAAQSSAAAATRLPADEKSGCSWTDFMCSILKALNAFLDAVGYILLLIPQALFGQAININKADAVEGKSSYFESPGVKVAWSISRDLVNLFFIILLIVMALTTIFDLGTLNVKGNLGKIIFIALIINFSMTIGLFVIDISNNLAEVFYQRATSRGTISESVSAMVNTQLAEAAFTGKLGASEATKNLSDRECGTIGKLTSNAQYASNSCEIWRTEQKQNALFNNEIRSRVAYAIVAKIIIYPVAAFVITAGAIMLVRRFITLLFLLVLSPFAFMAYLVPGRQGLWNQWWQKLFNQAFFFPAFTFCFMLSIIVMEEIQYHPTITQGGQGFISYMIGVGLMIGTLIVSSQMGAAGANAAMSLGKKWVGGMKSGATNWAKNKAQRRLLAPAQPMAEALSKGLGMGPTWLRAGIAATPFGWAAKGAAAGLAGAARVQKRAEDTHDKKYKDLDGGQLAMAYNRTIIPGERDRILKIAAEKGELSKFTEDQRSRAYSTAMTDPGKNQKTIRAVETQNPKTAIKYYKNRTDEPGISLEEKARRAKEQTRNTERIMASMSPSHIREKLDAEFIKDYKENPEIMKAVIKKWGHAQVEAAQDKFGDAFIEAWLETMPKMSSDEIKEAFRDDKDLRKLFIPLISSDMKSSDGKNIGTILQEIRSKRDRRGGTDTGGAASPGTPPSTPPTPPPSEYGGSGRFGFRSTAESPRAAATAPTSGGSASTTFAVGRTVDTKTDTDYINELRGAVKSMNEEARKQGEDIKKGISSIGDQVKVNISKSASDIGENVVNLRDDVLRQQKDAKLQNQALRKDLSERPTSTPPQAPKREPPKPPQGSSINQ